ncbi:MAG: restriction endonuclease subunit S, partial [Chloroflexota bacterium]|nr:restriction endonuclease subunit S [Chloroflexota bacterium]
DTLGSGKIPPIKAGPFGSSLTKDMYVPDGYKIYGQEQVIRGDYLYGDYFISKEKYKELESCSVKPGDILLSLVGTAGKVLVIPEGAPEGIINPRLIRFSFDKKSVISIFFKTLFETQHFQSLLSRQAQGGTMGVLNASMLRPMVIPVPPLPEQHAIAAALSDVDALLNSLDALIAKKRLVKQGAMQELLTPPSAAGQAGKKRLVESGKWEVKPLSEIAEIIMGQSPSSTYYNKKGDGLPLIQGNADISNRQTIKRVFTTQVTKFGRSGDVLMSVRAPVGEISRAVFDVCLGRGVCAIRYPNDFLYHYLIFKEPTWAKLSKGSTFDAVNSADVKAFPIEIPTNETEQTAIAEILSDMDAKISALEQKREKTRLLKQGMMQELLTGRIRLT